MRPKFKGRTKRKVGKRRVTPLPRSPSAFDLDPSRTALLRRTGSAEVRRRYARLRYEVYQKVVVEDALGLGLPANVLPLPTSNVLNAGLWSWLPNAEKLKAFGDWLDSTARDVFGGLREFAEGLADLAFRRGVGRAYDETNRLRPADVYPGADPGIMEAFRKNSRNQFVNDSVRKDQEHRDVLKKRIGDELGNGVDDVVEKLKRQISDAVIQDQSPKDAGKAVTEIIDSSRDSAVTTIKDEVVRDSAEGLLTGYEEAGVGEVFPDMEWTVHPELSKSGTCPRCYAMAGTVWSIEEARGKIPLHRNCKCSWKAVIPEPTKKDVVVPPIQRYAPGAGFAGNAEIRIPKLEVRNAVGPVTVTLTDDVLAFDRLLNAGEEDCGTGAGGFKPGNTCASGGLSPAAEEYRKTAWFNGNAGRKSAADLPPAKLSKLVRSYSAQILSAERSGKHDVAHELAHAAPTLLPGARLLSSAGAVERYDGARHEGTIRDHAAPVKVLRPGIEFPALPNKRVLGGGGGYAVVLRARVE